MKGDRRRAWLRQARRKARLGVEVPFCWLCGYSGPPSNLIPVKGSRLEEAGVPRSLLEKDHPAGRRNDADFTVLLCRNCHGEVGEDRLSYGLSMGLANSPRARAERVMSAIDLLSLAANKAWMRAMDVLYGPTSWEDHP